jgi:hypothetical protein
VYEPKRLIVLVTNGDLDRLLLEDALAEVEQCKQPVGAPAVSFEVFAGKSVAAAYDMPVGDEEVAVVRVFSDK